VVSETARFARGAPFAVAIGVAVGCAGGAPRYPLRDALTIDTDLTPVSVRCHPDPNPKDPAHVSCAPGVYVSPLAWDGIDNSIFRPLSDMLAVRGPTEAVNANSLDEVPDSAWFTNRIGVHPLGEGEIALGACTPSQMLVDPENAADGSWIIDKGKENGSSPGFRVRVPGKGKYMLKSDEPVPERPSAASAIGAAAYYAAGFNFTCEQVIYVKRSALKLTPGLTVTDNTERTRPFDQAALDRVLEGTTKKGDLLRFQASAWLEGRTIGPFRYEGTRADDPNDTIPHEDRRELRGGRLLAAWLDHFDAREQNSMDVWVAAHPESGPDSSPGYVRHYYLDTSDTLGSEWAWDGISRRLGHSYVLDWGDIGLDFVTLGLQSRPWDRAQRVPGFEMFGYFSTRDFSPEGWVNEYPNPAFSRMTERDGAWMARILAGFTPELIRTLARMGRFSDPRYADYVAGVLEGRLDAILARYLLRLSPLANIHVEAGDRLCAEDRAEARALRPADQFQYRARIGGRWLEVTRPGAGRVCAILPHVGGDGGPPDDAPERYLTVRLEDGVARGPLLAHLYDLGPTRGYRLAGCERPEP
jgi:hypothetical protein